MHKYCMYRCKIIVVVLVLLALWLVGKRGTRNVHANRRIHEEALVAHERKTLYDDLPPGLNNALRHWLMLWRYDIRQQFRQFEAQDIAPDDQDLIAHARKVIMPPSAHPIIKLYLPVTKTPQAKAVLDLLKNKRDGFFVECGALDGERASNTLYMERQLDWRGLLVEVDPFFFLQLIGHNRKSYSINACLSPRASVATLPFRESHGGLGVLTARGTPVPCYPLETLLRALNQTTVDFLSLDVEGKELEILKTIPFHKFDITILAVETAHVVGGKTLCEKYMYSQGYRVYQHINYTDVELGLYVDDTIFVKEAYLVANGF